MIIQSRRNRAAQAQWKWDKAVNERCQWPSHRTSHRPRPNWMWALPKSAEWRGGWGEGRGGEGETRIQNCETQPVFEIRDSLRMNVFTCQSQLVIAIAIVIVYIACINLDPHSIANLSSCLAFAFATAVAFILVLTLALVFVFVFVFMQVFYILNCVCEACGQTDGQTVGQTTISPTDECVALKRSIHNTRNGNGYSPRCNVPMERQR